AYGDTINTAARLEAANKALGTRICVSGDVAERAEGFRGRPIGDIVLRGKTKPLRAFEPLREEAYADPATRSYAEAFTKIEKGDPTATSAFAALLGLRSDDGLVNFHLKRLLNGGSGTVFDVG
ncbi:MAG: adenylate/guanylate cyclase domain-containing response regulator, partial [Hyphomicrobiales bacterium]|nr:adenylate/guanylate cyclase domain-containing response regulator [Hyphomicrobiales bacterium]